jgi:hypothetical protein
MVKGQRARVDKTDTKEAAPVLLWGTHFWDHDIIIATALIAQVTSS